MRRVESMDLLPGSCIVNGSSGPGVDLLRDVWPERGRTSYRVYLSDDAVGEAAALIGWQPPERVEEMRDRMHEAEERAAAAERRVAELEAVVDVGLSEIVERASHVAVKKPVKKAAPRKVVA